MTLESTQERLNLSIPRTNNPSGLTLYVQLTEPRHQLFLFSSLFIRASDCEVPAQNFNNKSWIHYVMSPAKSNGLFVVSFKNLIKTNPELLRNATIKETHKLIEISG